jgi:hypothetical protein
VTGFFAIFLNCMTFSYGSDNRSTAKTNSTATIASTKLAR